MGGWIEWEGLVISGLDGAGPLDEAMFGSKTYQVSMFFGGSWWILEIDCHRSCE